MKQINKSSGFGELNMGAISFASKDTHKKKESATKSKKPRFRSKFTPLQKKVLSIEFK